MSKDREFTYFCIGVGLGAAAAFLSAPKSGAATRKQIMDQANQGADFLKDQAESATNRAAEIVDRGTRTARHYKENVMAAVDAGKQTYREAVAATPESDYKL